MNRDIWVWRYELKSAKGLNSASSRNTHPGALIRVGAGYGCVHSWPELGDASLQDQLRSLQSDSPTKLAAISLRCAEIDGEARAEGKNLFHKVEADIPESHWLYQEGDDVTTIRPNGFYTVKLKIGPSDPKTELIDQIAADGLILRLDANHTYQFGEFRNWWERLSDQVKSQIEYVEDPVPWNWWNWHLLEQSGVPLAVDREIGKQQNFGAWTIFKPAINLEQNLKRARKLVVTTYMDHPIGQMWAAYHAQQFNQREPDYISECGLLTHRCFAKTEFSDRILVKNCVLQAPEGIGLGFDDLLESLPWKRLTT